VKVEYEIEGPTSGTALIASDDSVWITVSPKWWDLATWFWWWLCPADQKAVMKLHRADGAGGSVLVRTRAVRMARRHVRVGGSPQKARDLR
jgi:hypothetical protein